MSHTHPVDLPPEILCKIFVTYKLVTLVDNRSNPADNLTWIVVTHVCRSWRDAALGCGELWTTISISKPHLLDIMLERSKGNPLSVYYSGGIDAGVLAGLDKALSFGNPLRSVDVTIHPGITINQLSSVLPRVHSCAPHLERLRLSVASGSSLTTSISAQSQVEQFPPNFAMDLPQLISLHINNIGMQWNVLPLVGRRLVHLHLHHSRFHIEQIDPMSGLSWDVVTHYLTQLPLLETLDLRGMLPCQQDPDVTPVTLGNLKSVSLRDTSAGMAAFFHHVHGPAVDSVFLGVSETSGPPGTIFYREYLFRTLDQCFANMKLSLRHGGGGRHWIEGGVDKLILSEHREDPTFFSHSMLKATYRFAPGTSDAEEPTSPSSSLSSPSHANANTISFVGLSRSLLAIGPALMDAVEKHYDLRNVSRLSLDAGSMDRPEMYLKLLETTFAHAMPRLHCLTLHGSTFSQFIKSLKTSLERHLDTPGWLPYPALRELRLVNVDFYWTGGTSNDLIVALCGRPASLCLEKIVLRECVSFGRQDEESLKRAFHGLVVDWDGQEIVVTEEERESEQFRFFD